MHHLQRYWWPVASGALSAAMWTCWAASTSKGLWWLAGLADVGIVIVGAAGVSWYLERSERDKFAAFVVASGVASAGVSWWMS